MPTSLTDLGRECLRAYADLAQAWSADWVQWYQGLGSLEVSLERNPEQQWIQAFEGNLDFWTMLTQGFELEIGSGPAEEYIESSSAPESEQSLPAFFSRQPSSHSVPTPSTTERSAITRISSSESPLYRQLRSLQDFAMSISPTEEQSPEIPPDHGPATEKKEENALGTTSPISSFGEESQSQHPEISSTFTQSPTPLENSPQTLENTLRNRSGVHEEGTNPKANPLAATPPERMKPSEFLNQHPLLSLEALPNTSTELSKLSPVEESPDAQIQHKMNPVPSGTTISLTQKEERQLTRWLEEAGLQKADNPSSSLQGDMPLEPLDQMPQPVARPLNESHVENNPSPQLPVSLRQFGKEQLTSHWNTKEKADMAEQDLQEMWEAFSEYLYQEYIRHYGQ